MRRLKTFKILNKPIFQYIWWMDNVQIWIYIILGIIYLVGRARKKQQPPPGRNSPQQETQGPKPLTFEELLKEITEAKEPLPPVSRPVQEYVDYDDELEEEKEPARPDYDYNDYRKQETYQTFEQSKYEAFNRLSYEETMKLEDTKVEFGKFKVFDEDKKPSMAAQIAEDFNDMDRVKRAFIMSEIFNRKYA